MALSCRVGLCAVAIIAPVVAAVGMASGRESAPAAAAASPRELWIPPGTYTGIVFVSSAQQRRWVVSLVSNERVFPVALSPGATVTIPFERGWTVNVNDNARILVDGVSITVPTTVGPLTDEASMAISAWGISSTGPVQFVVR